MKTLLRIAAALALLVPGVPGVMLVFAALSAQTSQDFWIPLALGGFLVGNAIFAGAILLAVAEKFGKPAERQ
jgi:hypothetical protein